MDSADVALFVVMSIGSSISLLALGGYIFLALRGGSPILLTIHTNYHIAWKERAFLCFAAIGFFTCMYSGVEKMLFWIPGNWGYVDEENEFRAFRSVLAILLASFGGLSLGYLISRSTWDNTRLRLFQTHVDHERRIYTAASLAQLDAMKADFKAQITTLRDSVPFDIPHETPFRVECLMINSYRELLSLIEARQKNIN